MRYRFTHLAVPAAALLLAACSADRPGPAEAATTAGRRADVTPPWGPETPNFNLEVILRGDGFGLVKFRQPNDASKIINLDTRLLGMEPNTAYLLQRAVDTNLDGICSSTSWLTLGKGTTPQAITTDDRGAGEEELFRDLSAFSVGTTFDIHFRVITQATSAVVLTSDCYQFTVSQ
jgi:hypothetical protein